ncbi:D-hexose-6-phosphate mutarotase [Phytohalomonas tamaricis]|uniref:D-hexose-6-phosphate mutarotase n=1 Tax=Phytohalomonas tamaricis TaxID=2081032 RepID=UPI000D0B0ED8|nr:D-hexose-6-phosphate mutarotase [Phytohalomonas tamaricis]
MNDDALRQALAETQGRRDVEWHGRSLLVVNEDWGELVVSRHGGHLLHFAPKGQSGWLWTTSTPKPAPGAIRGGVPVCWPWFAESPDGQGPFHGPARTADWQIDAVDDETEGVEVHLSPCLRLDEQFTPRLVIYANTKRLKIELITEHCGKTPAKLTQALHTYFAVADTHACRIEGLAGTRYIDKLKDNSESEQLGELGVRGALDRIYHSSQPLILDDGQRRLRIAKQGSDSSVIWHPGAEAPSDVLDSEKMQFLCVEAACTRLDPVWLAPGAQHVLAMQVTLES